MKASCKRCNKIEEKNLDKVYIDGTFRYINAKGKAWGGRLCPQCFKETKRAAARIKRNQTPLDHTPKNCLQCNRTYIPKRNHSKFCEEKCKLKYNYHKRGKFIRQEQRAKIRAYDEAQAKKLLSGDE